MIVPVPAERIAAERLGRVHFVGIGGAGLSGIARIMLARGILVSGSDAQDSPVLGDLRKLGATCWVGHAAEHAGAVDTVVVSTAVREDNPEVREARRRGLRVLPRASALDAVMHGKRVVAVAGTHGKTTTTAMLTVALIHCGADPSYAIGGDLSATGRNAGDGSGALFVAEADESDGAFLAYTPFGAVVTNVEADHLDTYRTVSAYRDAFGQFVERIEPGGFLVVCADDAGAAQLGEQARRSGLAVVATGTVGAAALRADDVVVAGSGSRFTVVDASAHGQGRRLGGVELQVPGRHYVLDALCALGAGLQLGFGFAELRQGLSRYTGTRRRMEHKGTAAGVRVYDSYAHHPTEIAGDLAAARALAEGGRVVACFQPHLVSRTKIFAAEMGRALSSADAVVVMDVYAAREDPEAGVTGALVADQVAKPADFVAFEPVRERVPLLVAGRAQAGDVVVTLGAGDVTQLGPAILELLCRRAGSAEKAGSADGR